MSCRFDLVSGRAAFASNQQSARPFAEQGLRQLARKEGFTYSRGANEEVGLTQPPAFHGRLEHRSRRVVAADAIP
jgi:hypothetical protein